MPQALDLRQLTDLELMDEVHASVCGIEPDGNDMFDVYAEDFNQLFSLVDELKSRSLRGQAKGQGRSSLDS